MNANVMLKRFGASAAAALTLMMTTAGMAQTDRHDRRVVVRNMSDTTIQRFHATNTGTNRWGRDHLGEYVLSITVAFSASGVSVARRLGARVASMTTR